MTWRWVIFFSLTAAAWGVTVSGQVQLTDSKDHSGVVVWLTPIGGEPPETAPHIASVAHQHKTFVPHVVAIRTGSKVRFPNLDPFFHNAFSNYDGEIFDVGLRPPGSSPEITFRRPGVVRLFCNIHPTMSAIIVVLNTPWFAVSNAQGSFHIPGAARGTYLVQVFHERARPDVLANLERKVTIGSDDLTLPLLLISEEGYVEPPHKNKFGKDYPPIIVDQYPGGKR